MASSKSLQINELTHAERADCMTACMHPCDAVGFQQVSQKTARIFDYNSYHDVFKLLTVICNMMM